VACDLRDFRERIKLFERPWLLVVDQAGDFQLICFTVHLRRVVLVVEAIEGERPGDGAFGISRSELGAAEDRRLRPIIELGDLAQHAFGRIAINDVASGQKRERAEIRGAAQEAAPTGIRHQSGRVLDQKLRVDTGNDPSLSHGVSPNVL
jgi:hypothetical protein